MIRFALHEKPQSKGELGANSPVGIPQPDTPQVTSITFDVYLERLVFCDHLSASPRSKRVPEDEFPFFVFVGHLSPPSSCNCWAFSFDASYELGKRIYLYSAGVSTHNDCIMAQFFENYNQII